MVVITDYRVEIHFSKKPEQNIIDSLKVCEWKWNKYDYCWVNQKSEENIALAKELEDSLKPKDDIVVPMVTVDMSDILVRTNGFYCNANHIMKDIKGHLFVIDKMGSMKEKLVSLALCKTCSTYYILESTYSELKKYGIICGMVMSRKEYINHKDIDTSYLREKSPLKMLGYSVNKEDDLSTEQRWKILEMIVDKGIMSLDRELSYLDFFINRIHSSEDSVYCWKQDRIHMQEYVTEYTGHVLLK